LLHGLRQVTATARGTQPAYRQYRYCTCEQRSRLDIVSGRTVRTT